MLLGKGCLCSALHLQCQAVQQAAFLRGQADKLCTEGRREGHAASPLAALPGPGNPSGWGSSELPGTACHPKYADSNDLQRAARLL